MAFLGRLAKTGLALKAAKVIKREASKPQNQRKARELVAKIGSRGKKKRR